VERRGEGRLEASASVRCDRKALQRNLLGLVVGINDYSQAAGAKSGERLLRDLNTPLDDMEAIRKAWMSQQGGALYAKVDIVFLNERKDKVDRATILKELRGLAEKAGPDDQVFVFLAGHGTVLDPEGKRNFVFCCPDFHPLKPKTSINARELYEALADIPCRKVVFLDVCHSGEVVRPVRDLTPGGRGPTILAACDSGESSWEPLEAKGAAALNQKSGAATPGADHKRPEAKGAMAASHSFFVAALLEAFGDRFQRADQDGDGRLDAREIYEYTSNRVPELLKDAKLNETQTPTCFPRRLGRNALLARSSPSRK
jgi:uncharacterized caspase-like protein